MKFSYLLLAIALTGCSIKPDNTVKFPVRAYQHGVYGTVHVKYDVNRVGRVENVVVEDDKDGYFAKQIVSDMKHWRLDAGKPKKGERLTIAFECRHDRDEGDFLEN